MGNILFKMLVGTVPFKGKNHAKVYIDIKARNIGWPRPDILAKLMSKDAERLIDSMIQLDPTKRLGGSLESMDLLKKHSFFEGIDFEEVSSPDYRGCVPLVEKIKVRVAEELRIKEEAKRLKAEEQDLLMKSDSMLSSDDLAVSVFDVSRGSGDDVIIEGSLIKRNWYNKMQLRHFQMFKNGDIKYHVS